ncbi:MAG: hypothetical protein LBK60_05770 [Verrucomicrobiales bacterium]|jgi:predicted RNA-binding Zn-ribbon protein involved in translation (DUF1610 family)|nr:hypothetical protein [Verrucomicrobiales bacterium]
MKLDFTTALWLYVTLPLIITISAWLLFAWHKHRQRRDAHRTYPCPHCGLPLRPRHEIISMRCPGCGARINLSTLIIKQTPKKPNLAQSRRDAED